jgi:hypothetical protein
VQHLVSIGADVNWVHPGSGRSPLHKAAKIGDLVIMKLLLGVPGIAVNAQENKGYTPLDRATSAGHTAAVAMLEKAGGQRGMTESHWLYRKVRRTGLLQGASLESRTSFPPRAHAHTHARTYAHTHTRTHAHTHTHTLTLTATPTRTDRVLRRTDRRTTPTWRRWSSCCSNRPLT